MIDSAAKHHLQRQREAYIRAEHDLKQLGKGQIPLPERAEVKRQLGLARHHLRVAWDAMTGNDTANFGPAADAAKEALDSARVKLTRSQAFHAWLSEPVMVSVPDRRPGDKGGPPGPPPPTGTGAREPLVAYLDNSGDLYTHAGYRGTEDEQIVAWLRDALSLEEDEARIVYAHEDGRYDCRVSDAGRGLLRLTVTHDNPPPEKETR